MTETFLRFRNRKMDDRSMSEFGFVRRGDFYLYTEELMDGQFNAVVSISLKGRVGVKVVDTSTGGDCDTVRSSDITELNELTLECRKLLERISDSCFYEVFPVGQPKEVIERIWTDYHCAPEFLWAKFPDNAVFRRKSDRKWFAAILTVSPEKVGRKGKKKLTVIDLKACPEDLKALVDGRKYLPGYHMNKNSWYTIVLDGSVSTDEIAVRIADSFLIE